MLLLALVGAATSVPAQTPRPVPRTSVELLSPGAGSGAIRFQVTFPPPRMTSVEIDGSPRTVPTWPDLLPVGTPGDPAVPARLVRVAVPPRGTLSFQVETTEGGVLRGVHFPPVPGIEGAASPTEARETPIPQVEILSVGIERGVRVADVAVRPVAWNPANPSPSWASGVRVTVRAAGSAPPVPSPRASRPDETGRRSRARTLLNPDDAEAFAPAGPDTVPPPGDGVPAVWFDDADGWLKIEITANGVYSLDRAALAAAGVPVDTVDPRTLRLFSGPLVPDVSWAALGWDSLQTGIPDSVRLDGAWRHVYERPGFVNGFGDAGGMEEVAALVTGEEDGSLDAGDRVVFYALGPDNFRDRFGLPLDTPEDYFENPYTDRTVYWLGWGGTTFPAPPRRMESVDATPQPSAPLVAEATARSHAERDRIYSPTQQEAGLRWEQWFWEEMTSLAAGYQFRVALPGIVPFTTLDFHLRLWGVNQPLPFGVGLEALHHVDVTVDDQPLGVVQWGSDQNPDLAFSARDVSGAGIPARNPADFLFRLPDIGSDPGRVDRVYLAWIDVTYRRGLDLAGRTGELPLDAGDPGRRVRIGSVPQGAGSLVLDVTEFRTPRLLANAVAAGGGLELSYDRPDPAVLAMTVADSLRAPAAVQRDLPPSTWLRRITDPLDYVILAYDEFTDEAEILAAWRRDHLYAVTPGREARVRVVRVSDVMDEFAWGMQDPVAIRYFLEYAYRFYGPGSDRLAYCLFLGDHTYDVRDYLGTGTPDLVPSWEDTRDPTANPVNGNVQYASDDPLARFDGRDPATGRLDPYTDVYLGRITARTGADAARALNRIVSAEAQPNYGPWRARAILVSDDICGGGTFDPLGTRFVDESELLDGLYPAAFDRRKVYLVDYGVSCSILSKPQARADLVEQWNEGAWLINYEGHGSEFAWAEEQVLTRNELAGLTNEGRLPVVIATASKTGWFNRPGSQGLAESMLLQANGGAVSSSGSGSDFTFAEPAFRTNQRFAQYVFGGGDPSRPEPVGAAFQDAKQPEVNDGSKYHFFGDPAMLPPVPGSSLAVSSPDSLGRGLRIDVGMQIEGGALRTGAASVRAEDARAYQPIGTTGSGFLRPGERIFEGEASVVADTARSSFVVPADALGGDDARVRAYAWGMDWDALGARFPLPLGGTADPAGDTMGPAVSFPVPSVVAAPGQELEATLEDPSGIKLTGESPPPLELVVTDDTGAETTRVPLADRFAYERDSSTKGTVRFPVPSALEEGPYVFTLFASDNFDNRSQASVDVTVRSTTGPVLIGNVVAFPNPSSFAPEPMKILFTLDRAAHIDLHLYSVKGRLVLEDSIEGDAGQNVWTWDGRDAVQDEVANGVYLLQLKGPAEGGDAPKVLERLVVLR